MIAEETKTNVMDLNKIDPIRIDETEIELVAKFKYLASVIIVKQKGYSKNHYK